jgi:antirestriction protein ArdC
MTQQEARKAIDRALETLGRDLEEGHSEAMLQYLATMRRFRQSYSWGNTLLIWTQRPDAVRVAGFHTWKGAGRSVRKGEKGIQILAPCVSRRKETEDEEDTRTVRSFRAVYVFDVSQPTGEPLPEPPRVTGDPGDYFETMEAFVTEELCVRIEYPASLGRAHGRCRSGLIEVVASLPTAHKLSVLVHETAHHILHINAPEEVRKDKTLVELQAEATAHVVCQTLGLDTNHAGADYIALWGGSRDKLRQSLSAIHQAAGVILSGLQVDERNEPDERPAARRR